MKEASALQWKVGDIVGAAATPVTNSPAAAWHLVQVMTGRERTIAVFLHRYGFTTYFPLTTIMKAVPRKKLSLKQRRSRARIMRPKIVPLLPGYLLVLMDMKADDWHALFRLAGVRGVWCEGNLPVLIRQLDLDNLRRREVDGVIPGDVTLGKLFCCKVGDNVRIASGPFASFPAVDERLPEGYQPGTRLEELDESKRVTLLVNIFGRPTPVDLALGEFEPV
jgi:transcription antitermination factor NusG